MNCVPLFVIMEFGTPKRWMMSMKNFYGLFRPDFHDRPGLYPLCELVYGDKLVCIALRHPFEGPDQIEPL
jgi:hypothetical protein